MRAGAIADLKLDLTLAVGVYLNIKINIFLFMPLTSAERRRQKWVDEILSLLSFEKDNGLTVDEIFDKIKDPSKSTIRIILNQLQASKTISRTDAKPWKWHKITGDGD